MFNRQTLTLLGAGASLIGSLLSLRKTSGTIGKMRALFSVATSVAFVYRAYQEQQQAVTA